MLSDVPELQGELIKQTDNIIKTMNEDKNMLLKCKYTYKNVKPFVLPNKY